MAQIIQNISVDVSKPNFFQAIVAKQYDSGSRFLKATLIHCGKTVEIDPTSTVLINAKRSSDGEEKAFAGVANDDNTVTVPLAYWMLELEGTVKCDISAIGADGTKLTSTSFTVEVESASCNSGDVSEDENYDVLVKLIEDVSKVTPDQAYKPESENAQSGKAVAEALESLGGLAANIIPITEACNVWELESGIYSLDTDATGATVSLSSAGDWFYYGLLIIADTTGPYGGKTFLALGCDEAYMSVARIGVVDLEGMPVPELSWGYVLTENCVEINTIKDRLDALEQQVNGFLDNTVTFTVDGAPYEITSVKNGNSVNAPLTSPTSAGYMFSGWRINGENIAFPYTPENDVEITAAFISEAIGELYTNYNVSQEQYPYIFIVIDNTGGLYFSFANSYTYTETTLKLTTVKRDYTEKATINNYDDIDEVIECVKSNITSLSATERYSHGAINANYRIYTNANLNGSIAKVYVLE